MSFKLKANIIIFKWHNIINLFKTSCNVVDLFMLTSILRFWLLGIGQECPLHIGCFLWNYLSCSGRLCLFFEVVLIMSFSFLRTTGLKKKGKWESKSHYMHSSLYIFFAAENTVNVITCVLLFLILFAVPREMGFVANCLIVLNQWVFI